jgi:hypothetical protein
MPSYPAAKRVIVPKPLAATPGSAPTRNWRYVASAALFLIPYVALLFWFKDVDVYHRHFSESGWIVGAYNAFRLLFIFYLFWIVEAAGALLLRAAARPELAELAVFERLAVCFFTGTGVWHVALLGLGYLNLYTVPVAIVLTLPFVALAYGDARDAALAARKAAGERKTTRGHFLWIAALSVASVVLLLVKGLYPGGNVDYFTSYFPYYNSVIANHGIWPNEVWYHYFYDKGAGLTFLAMLLTDPLAPQLVTFSFMAIAVLVIFYASRAAAPDTHWPYFAALLFVVIYIYTPNWAEFEKTHELTTALVIAGLWAAGGALARCGVHPNRLWPVVAAAAFTGAVIITPPIAVFLSTVFGILFVWYIARRTLARARLAFFFSILMAALLLGTLAVNYATAGIFSDLVVLPPWRFADVETLHRLHWLPSMLTWTWVVSWDVADYVPWSRAVKVLDQTSRFDLVYPLIDGALAVAIIAVIGRWRNGRWSGAVHAPHQTGIFLATVPVFLAIALTGGRTHFDSFYRFAGFMVPVVLVGSIGLWGLPISGANARFVRIVQDRRVPFLVFALCVATIAIASHPTRLFRLIVPRAAEFAVGTISIDTAYTLQPFPYPLAENGIFPGARGAYEIVGAGVPIWTLHHAVTYCMLPGCRMESFREYALPDWTEFMFGSPERGRQALQASGHNYFLFVRDLPIVDCLPLSPLFSPDNIARFLGIRWTDGTTALLTWLGPGVQPLDNVWIDSYRSAVAQSDTVRRFPYEEMKLIFTQSEATPHPWRSFALPWQQKSELKDEQLRVGK